MGALIPGDGCRYVVYWEPGNEAAKKRRFTVGLMDEIPQSIRSLYGKRPGKIMVRSAWKPLTKTGNGPSESQGSWEAIHRPATHREVERLKALGYEWISVANSSGVAKFHDLEISKVIGPVPLSLVEELIREIN